MDVTSSTTFPAVAAPVGLKSAVISPGEEPWSRRAVVYQIYPRSFKDSNGDGVGDLQGIIDRLDYLNDGTESSLGVDAIWLSPIYKSPMVDFGYDVSDYCDIDPLFGNLETFDRLVAEAHRRNIRVILDFIPNHTSDQHPWFLEARSSRNNRRRDWYIWRDPKPDGTIPNNWLSVFGGSAWELDEATGQYYMHSFLAQQPDLNWHNPEVRHAMYDSMRFWLKRGVDGFRIDAIHHLLKDELYRDDPPNPLYDPGQEDPYHAFIHSYSQRHPRLFEAVNGMHNVLREFDGKFLISEVSEVFATLEYLMEFYNSANNEFHSPFNFNLISLPWDAAVYREFIDRFDASLATDPRFWPNYVLGNHDRSRVASRLGLAQARVAAMLILTLRGMPFIYYGDELGMEDVPVPTTLSQDPFEHNVPGMGLGRDPQRTPMQWDANAHAGFSKEQPWLPVAENYASINVERERQDPQSMLSLYRALTHFRKKSRALREGNYESFDTGSQHVFGYIRTADNERVLIVLNFSEAGQMVLLSEPHRTLICSTYMDMPAVSGSESSTITLRPYEGMVFSI